ncbi:MAG: TIGR03790 family protein, partial [Deltaproteobacteria bacterium]|nr:TIGR03790 family protein [Deltaproteobacteria bacterium]
MAVPCWALEPHEIVVLANRNASRSVGLAKYYMEKRGIPEDHLIQLRITDKEWCEREDYEKKVVEPLRNFLKDKDPMGVIRCILVMYGLPLKLEPPEISKEEKRELNRLETRKDNLTEQVVAVPA